MTGDSDNDNDNDRYTGECAATKCNHYFVDAPFEDIVDHIFDEHEQSLGIATMYDWALSREQIEYIYHRFH